MTQMSRNDANVAFCSIYTRCAFIHLRVRASCDAPFHSFVYPVSPMGQAHHIRPICTSSVGDVYLLCTFYQEDKTRTTDIDACRSTKFEYGIIQWLYKIQKYLIQYGPARIHKPILIERKY